MKKDRLKLMIVFLFCFIQVGFAAEYMGNSNYLTERFDFSDPTIKDYAINFTGTSENYMLDSVIVQNLTRGTNVTVPAGSILKLCSFYSNEKTSADDESMSIYPNPMEGSAIVSFFAKEAGDTKIDVCSSDGENVITKSFYLQKGVNSFQLSLPKSLYVVQVKARNFSYSAKVICKTTIESKSKITYIGVQTLELACQQKNSCAETAMQYFGGDTLLYIGFSGKDSAFVTDVPTGSKTITINFNVSNLTKISKIHFNANAFPTLTTNSVSSITSTSAICGGNITDGGNGYVISRGVCWSTSANPTKANSTTSDGTGATGFTSSIIGLQPLTTYYVRAYATNTSGNTAYGNEILFNTLTAATPPILTTISVSSITSTSAISGGNISSDGGVSVTACGICWSTTTNPTIANSTTSDRTGSTGFTSNITGLSPLTTYYIRAYATNSVGTAYGNEVSFITRSIYPTLTTNSVSSITSTSAICGGNITDGGNGYVIFRGVCWSTSANPTIANSNTLDGTGATGFTSRIISLQPLITYHVRAYATNTSGNTAYGNEVIFNTLAATPPILTTTAISSITSTSAISGGNISSDGGAYVFERGVCWSTTQNPTIANNKTLNGEDIGNYESSITGLILGDTYYVRAYATNSAGTAYGSQVSFVTKLLKLPTVTTTAATSITSTSAVCGGVVNDDGGAPVTARGICYSTSENPTISNSSKISNGTGVGSFTCKITDLILNLKIYVRAYATNSVGTNYGDQISFKTALAVGDVYEGGRIAYIFEYGDPAYISGQTHGLIAAFTDIGCETWRNGNNPIISVTGTALGTGKANTETICNNQGHGEKYAAKICLDYSFGDYSDWFLPSQEELNKLYINRIAIDFFVGSYYWSSSQLTNDSNWAYAKDFNSGNQVISPTYMPCYVRPIRYF